MKKVVIRLGALFIAMMLACSWAMAQETGAVERALAVYTQGKNLYDAGDFKGARAKFVDAIAAEPTNPRWHYNLGLVDRQLNNYPAAQQSLLKARELDPEYKRAEIDQKLTAMGFHPSTSAAALQQNPPVVQNSDTQESDGTEIGFFQTLAVLAGVVGGIFLLVRVVRSKRADPHHSSKGTTNSALIPRATARMDQVAAQLVQVEHALRLGEHADLRSQLEHATGLERTVRQKIERLAGGDAKSLRKVETALGDLERSVTRAREIAVAAFGARAFAGQGERVACYFCAKPLANADYRHPVTMKQGDAVVNVMTCPDCATVASQGRAPTVLTGTDSRTHWSELASFDPYVARHAVNSETVRTPGWKFTQQRSAGELALIAGGAALAGGAAAAMLLPEAQAASTLLDLDTARENALAQEAARASAQQAAGQRRESFSDHS
ncbi:MAG: tetratricopeptide repeat protein [Comamonadaceae bacterium]|nr:tetratricopeptide repeat protein [Comamonadaceae bacterium]